MTNVEFYNRTYMGVIVTSSSYIFTSYLYVFLIKYFVLLNRLFSNATNKNYYCDINFGNFGLTCKLNSSCSLDTIIITVEY